VSKPSLEQIFTYHRPFGNQPQRYEWLRKQAKLFAEAVEAFCPPSRERSLAMTAVQEAIMWANASIAINEVDINEVNPSGPGEANVNAPATASIASPVNNVLSVE
jgi:hypothetical protein